MLLLLLNQPAAAEEATPGVATGAGIAPSVTGAATPDVGLASGAGIAPSVTGSGTSPTPGIAAGAGIAPSVTGHGSTVTSGLATAAGVTPGARGAPVVVAGLAAGSGTSIGSVEQLVGLDQARAAELLKPGTTASFERALVMASPEKPSTAASFERPTVGATFEQAEAEIVFT